MRVLGSAQAQVFKDAGHVILMLLGVMRMVVRSRL